MTEQSNNKDGLIDELSTLKQQLNGGPEFQQSIPELDLTPAKKIAPATAKPSQSDLETLIDELDDKHLSKLEQQLRSTIDDT